jgi:hypothetical protein
VGRKSNAEIRFLSRVEFDAGCWYWTGWKDKDGYGVLSVNNRNVRAHRFSWEQVNGPIPGKMCVCHMCDTPSCVNPDHLFLGSNEDNSADRHAKGRTVKVQGERHGVSKLTAEQVREIRRLYDRDVRHREIASKFGITPSTVSGIGLRNQWKHVT